MSGESLERPDGSRVPLDTKGYLLDRSDWSSGLAEQMAAADGIELTADHWQVIAYFQDYFERFEIEPPMRALVRHTRELWGEARGNSRYLYRLFPDGPGTQACRYAGLPRPVSCI
ncbi:MAG: TusE/DsrC/DsvC family sulfur relay protein [Gammaproteobacteria bacterium]|nr:TusE/DsrC/DsvC family sulfur relay protein [Gammaproteobacteria bacterium]